jgi:hypothetical protein
MVLSAKISVKIAFLKVLGFVSRHDDVVPTPSHNQFGGTRRDHAVRTINSDLAEPPQPTAFRPRAEAFRATATR